MGKGCKSSSHQMFKDRAKNRVDDLQGMFTDLQFARKESRAGDVAVLEEQVHQMLREWKAELNEVSPASSVHGVSRVSSDLSSEIRRLLQIYEEEDDATSKLADCLKPEPDESVAKTGMKPDPDVPQGNVYQEGYYTNSIMPEHDYHGINECKIASSMGPQTVHGHCLEGNVHLDFKQFDMHQDSTHQDVAHNGYTHCGAGGHHDGGVVPNISDLLPTISPPASAFLRPKCALWDCPRPAKGTDEFEDYCSSIHAILAFNEGPPGMSPVLRPGGIDLKDGPLFAALIAKTQGKNVGIPECEGAATAKSPWNAPELFDLSVLDGETLREWLFFDKPRRAFESGNRKQRSLPDYNGRGWHESRKQVIKEFGGLKRSYYMDPQPLNTFEWHLYEYEINNCDACALYRLELKLVDPNKNTKGKISGIVLLDPHQQPGKVSPEFPSEGKRSAKSRAKLSMKDTAVNAPSPCPMEDDVSVGRALDPAAPAQETVVYGPNLPYGYTFDGTNLNHYYGT